MMSPCDRACLYLFPLLAGAIFPIHCLSFLHLSPISGRPAIILADGKSITLIDNSQSIE